MSSLTITTKGEKDMGSISKITIKTIIFFICIVFICTQASALTANARFSPVQGAAPLTVMFSDYSEGNPVEWYWDFGDGFTGEGPQMMYTYMNPGVYTVQLRVIDRMGQSDTAIFNQAIQVLINPYMPAFPVIAPPFNADFTATPQSGPAPLAVQFTDISKGEPAAWEWSFGDGTFSAEKNPVHVYTKPGAYSVILKTSRDTNTGMKERRNYVKVSPGGTDIPVPEVVPQSTMPTPPVQDSEPIIGQLQETEPDITPGLKIPPVCESGLTLHAEKTNLIPGEQFIIKVSGRPFEKIFIWISPEEYEESGISPSSGSVVEGGLSEEPQAGIYYLIDERNESIGISPYIIDETVLFDQPGGQITIGSYVPDTRNGNSIYELIPDTTSDISTWYYGIVALDKNGEQLIQFTSRAESYGLYSINIVSQEKPQDEGCIESILLSLYPLS